MTTIGPTVDISAGAGVTVRGRTWTVTPLPVWDGDTSQAAADYTARNTGKTIDIMAFRGIPYATPSRFYPSVLRSLPVGTTIASEAAPAPLQISSEEETGVGREEFGFDKTTYGFAAWGTKEQENGIQNVNVYTRAVTPLKPVIVIIHGGAWVQNWMGNYTTFGHRLAAEGAVVVAVEYRLSSFGHMWVEGMDTTLPFETPSVALTDIRTALQWVQANIQYFGGDKNNVTLTGYSAGGEAIFSLMSSAAFDGLYHKAWPCCGGGGPSANYEAGPNYGQNPGYKILADRYKRVIEACAPYMADASNPARTVAAAIAADGYLSAVRTALTDTFISQLTQQNMYPFVDGTFLKYKSALDAARDNHLRLVPTIIDVCENDPSIFSQTNAQHGYARYLGYFNEQDLFSRSWMGGYDPTDVPKTEEQRRTMQLHAVWCAGAYGIAKLQKQRGGTIYLNLFNYVSRGASATGGARHTQNRMYMTGNIQAAVQGYPSTGEVTTQKVYANDLLMASQYMQWMLNFAGSAGGNPNTQFVPALPGFNLFATPANLSLQQFNTASPGWNMIGSNGTPLAWDSPVAATYNTTWYAGAWTAYMSNLGV